MNLRNISVCALMAVLPLSVGLADDVECLPFKGQVEIFPADEGTCPLVEENGNRFDFDFAFDLYGNPGGLQATCFSGNLIDATIKLEGDSIRVEGTTESALSAAFVTNPSAIPSAASAIRIKRPKILKGKLFTIDTFRFDKSFHIVGERLDVVGGSKTYKRVTEDSFIKIFGDALAEPSNFKGRICFE